MSCALHTTRARLAHAPIAQRAVAPGQSRSTWILANRKGHPDHPAIHGHSAGCMTPRTRGASRASAGPCRGARRRTPRACRTPCSACRRRTTTASSAPIVSRRCVMSSCSVRVFAVENFMHHAAAPSHVAWSPGSRRRRPGRLAHAREVTDHGRLQEPLAVETRHAALVAEDHHLLVRLAEAAADERLRAAPAAPLRELGEERRDRRRRPRPSRRRATCRRGSRARS